MTMVKLGTINPEYICKVFMMDEYDYSNEECDELSRLIRFHLYEYGIEMMDDDNGEPSIYGFADDGYTVNEAATIFSNACELAFDEFYC